MRVHVDAWDPSYGRAYEVEGGPSAASTAPVDTGVERPPGAWTPLNPAPEARAPRVVLLVDGVRRVDARVWVEDDHGVARPGVCASYAAGAVRCDLAAGAAALGVTRVAHGLFAPGPAVSPLRAHATAEYLPYPVTKDDPATVDQEVQRRLTDLEVAVSRAAAGAGEPDLLLVDGPLRGRPGALGYIKTQHAQYLDAELVRVVAALSPGQRTPLFLLGGQWRRYSWYLRLPGSAGSPWAGIVRLECPAEWPVDQAIRHADITAVTLPRFASTAYKDARAPQNLVPIAGLERRLRALLGDPRLLLRGLRTAARGVA